MRYRLMATYRGVPYEAGVGPSGADVVLFAACPPPEELGFEPATGHWRKRVIRAEVDALWESRPVGNYRGEPCVVLDDLGDRLHIAYLGMDATQAAELGYWQIDRDVFELLISREEVTDLTEERIDHPLRLAASGPAPGYPYGGMPAPPVHGAAPLEPQPSVPPDEDGWQPPGTIDDVTGQQLEQPPASTVPASAKPAPDGGGRAARRQRVPTRDIFCELADLAAIPRTAYALETETDGAMCLLPAVGGFEVFVAAEGARHEMRSFADEEVAYFYLFGVLAAEAVRNGSLVPSATPLTGVVG